MSEDTLHDPKIADDSKSVDLAQEIAKLILSTNLTFLYGTTQVVQAITAVLLTGYLSWLVRYWDSDPLKRIPLYLLAPPLIFWVVALVLVFMNTIFYSYRGTPFTVGHLESTVNAYEDMLRHRRRIVLVPAILTLLGIGCLAGLLVRGM
jgi:hypothetical protein